MTLPFYYANTKDMKNMNTKDETALYTAMMELKSIDELRRFMADLCTPGEITAFAERWAIARLLNEGNQGYREIAALTGASTTTVARVARFLLQERHHGYRMVLDRLYPQPKQTVSFHGKSKRPAKKS